MSMLNDLFKKLKLLFGEAEGAAAAAVAQTTSQSGALRGEMRKRRRLDMRERLAQMIQPDGSVSGGIVRFINLYPIAAAVGERWPILFPKVELMSESVIRRDIQPDDLWLVHGDLGFAVIFTEAGLTDEVADQRCLRIFEDIREYLLGKKLVAIPSFVVDPRILLRALDEGGAPPLHLLDIQPRGVWMPPATELAKRATYLPPDVLAALPPGPGIEVSDTVEPDPTSVAEVARSHDRAQDRDVGSWHHAGDRAEHVPDWGQSFDRAGPVTPLLTGLHADDDDGDIFGGRRRIPVDADFVAVPGEDREQTRARYVTMGRFNTMFDAIDVDFRSFWTVKQEMIGTFLADPRLREAPADAPAYLLRGDPTRTLFGSFLFERAEAVNASAALDIAVLRRTIEAVMPRLAAGAQFFFVVPVGYPTLLRKGDRYAFFDVWATLPEEMRRFGRFWCYQPAADVGDLALGEVIAMLDRTSRVPIFHGEPDSKLLNRLASLRIHAVSFDGAPLRHPEDGAAYADRLRQACNAAHKAGLSTFLERIDRPTRQSAVTIPVGAIEGPRLSGANGLPNRPKPIAADRFAEGS